MGNTPNSIDFDTKTLADFLNDVIGDGTYADLLTVLKFDAPTEAADATDIDAAAGQLWANLFDDYLRATYPTHYKGQKVWGVPDAAARDALGSDDSLAVDDLAWVKDTHTLWYVVSVDGASASTWAEITAVAPIETVDTERFQIVGTELQLSANMETAMNLYLGTILETIDVDVTESGGTVSLELQKDGGGDLTCVFSDGYFVFDTTPVATIALTAGTDTVPVLNFVYIDQATKLLTKNTTGFPAAEHCAIAEIYVQSAPSVAADGAYKVHVWTDHSALDGDNGHIAHVNAWIREQPATWKSGVDWTLTITPNGGAPDTVIYTSLAGVVLQLHDHAFDACSGTPDLFVANDSVAAFDKITDLNELLTDALGASMSAKYFSLVVWGVVNESGDCKLMVNLPNGSYNNQSDLDDDISNFAVYSIPAEFTGVGFLIAQFNLRHQVAASGTWTSIEEIDLRGTFPGGGAGGAGPAGDVGAPGPRWTFDAGTADADPGVGKFRYNNATQSAATFMYVNDDTVDGQGMLRSWFIELGEGDEVLVQQEGTPGNSRRWVLSAGVTTGAGYFKIPIGPTVGTHGNDLVAGTNISLTTYVVASSLAKVLVKGNSTSGNDINLAGADAIVGDPVPLRTDDADTTPVAELTTAGANGAVSAEHVGDRTPIGNVTGNPGDYYKRVSGVSSRLYQHKGAGADTTSWEEVATTAGVGAPGPRWVFDSDITDTDPGVGKWKFNNATQNSATFIYIDFTCFDSVAFDKVTAFLNNGDTVYIQQEQASVSNKSFGVTGPATASGTYVKIPVALLTGDQGSDFVADAKQQFSFLTPSAGIAAVLQKGNDVGSEPIVGDPITFQSPAADTTAVATFTSQGTNGEISKTFVGDRTPIGNVTGRGGDYYRRVSGATSELYKHVGASADNTSWEVVGGGGAAVLPSIDVSRTTNLTITGTPQGLDFDQEDGPSHDAGEYTWVTTDEDIESDTGGTYIIHGECTIVSTSVSASEYVLEWYRNGSPISDGAFQRCSTSGIGSDDTPTSVASTIIRALAADDVIGFRISRTSGSGGFVDADSARLSLIKIDVPSP